jgi:hypothetical protein
MTRRRCCGSLSAAQVGALRDLLQFGTFEKGRP